MNSKTSNVHDDQLIESIIYSFWCNFCCAIRRNRNDTFAAAHLSACLLEHFSGFLYAAPVNARIEQFIATYMEPYSDLGLYGVLRGLDDRLIERLASVMFEIPSRLFENGRVGLDRGKVIEVFTNDLQEAFDKASDDLRRDEQKKQNAIAWVRDHPIFECYGICLYTSEQQSTLMRYYEPILKKQHLFSNGHFSFGFNFGDGGYEITILLDKKSTRQNTRVPIEVFIELLGLKRPEEILLEED